MRQKAVPSRTNEPFAGFIGPPLQVGRVKPCTNFWHEVLVKIPR